MRSDILGLRECFVLKSRKASAGLGPECVLQSVSVASISQGLEAEKLNMIKQGAGGAEGGKAKMLKGTGVFPIENQKMGETTIKTCLDIFLWDGRITKKVNTFKRKKITKKHTK